MLNYDFDKSPGFWLCGTSHIIRKYLSSQLAAAKVTYRQFEVLATLARSSGCGSQTEIADALGIEPHTLAGVLKRMERDGLLERTSCDQDRRKNKVQPTRKAEERWQRATHIAHEIRSEMTEGLTPEELVSLKNICDRIQANIAAKLAAAEQMSSRESPRHAMSHSPMHSPIPFSPTIHP